MLYFPNCKINLGLYVTRKRDDGYHDIETIFYPVGFCDALEIVPGGQTRLSVTGLAVDGDNENNLVLKAYKILADAFPGRVPAFNIFLHKVIPMGAGLGGGSADGAFMLKLVNDYCGLALTPAQLATFALQLGSDCPFFIYNTPQFATGRGEQMSPVEISLSNFSLQLICPQVHVSTRDAFGIIKPAPASFNLNELGQLPIADWKHIIRNDFEAPVFSAHPMLHSIKYQLYEQGAIYASMTGSGSAMYGIFPKGQKPQIDAEVPFKDIYVN